MEEDTCSDTEQAHAAESIHVLVINPTYPAPPPPPPPPPPPADHIEVGAFLTLKMMNFILKMMNFILKMMNFMLKK